MFTFGFIHKFSSVLLCNMHSFKQMSCRKIQHNNDSSSHANKQVGLFVKKKKQTLNYSLTNHCLHNNIKHGSILATSPLHKRCHL